MGAKPSGISERKHSLCGITSNGLRQRHTTHHTAHTQTLLELGMKRMMIRVNKTVTADYGKMTKKTFFMALSCWDAVDCGRVSNVCSLLTNAVATQTYEFHLLDFLTGPTARTHTHTHRLLRSKPSRSLLYFLLFLLVFNSFCLARKLNTSRK